MEQEDKIQELPVMKLQSKKSKLSLSKKESKLSSNTYGDDYDDEDYYEDDSYDGFESKKQISQNGPVSLKDTEIFQRLQQKIVQDIECLTNMNFDKSLLIFKHYQFNKDSFTTHYFADSDNIIKKYGLNLGPYKEITENLECLICFDDEKTGYELPCGNQYCIDCISGHIQSKIHNKIVFFGCMEEGCNYHFEHSLIQEVLTKNKLEHDKKLYLTNLSRVYAEENKSIKWCPGLDCEYCVQDEWHQYQNVECPNNHKFCFKCRLPSWHKPCPCIVVKSWNEKNGQSTLDDKWIQANTRQCPHCKRHIQRSLGCDFMRCAPPGGCGQAFCYICLLPITEKEHMAHASCKIKAKNDKQQEAKDYLEKVTKYFDRVKVCEVVQNKAKEILTNSLEEKRNELYEKCGVSYQETQFLSQAFQILIDSRDALKYSYIFSFQVFQLQGKMQKSQDLFEQFQAVYEDHCEKLAMSLEMELNQFLESIKDFKNVHTYGMQDPNKIKEFFILKEKINSSAQAINKSKVAMIDAVENGDIYIENA